MSVIETSLIEEAESCSSWRDITTQGRPRFFQRLVLAVLSLSMMQLSGINLITYYASVKIYIFEGACLTRETTDLQSSRTASTCLIEWAWCCRASMDSNIGWQHSSQFRWLIALVVGHFFYSPLSVRRSAWQFLQARPHTPVAHLLGSSHPRSYCRVSIACWTGVQLCW